MTSKKKSASKLALALSQAKVQANDLQDRIGPAVEDARERLTPVVEDARERLTPVVDDARDRLAELAGTVAVKLDETLPDKATPAVVSAAATAKRTSEKSGWFKRLLLLAGVGAIAAFVAQKLRGGSSEPQWQSTPPARPTPAPAPTESEQAADTSSAPAAAVAGMAAADAATATGAQDGGADAAGGSPGEAAADATDTPHAPTTPDSPAEKIQVTE